MDIDDGTTSGTPDGAVTIDDLLFFLAQFEAGAAEARCICSCESRQIRELCWGFFWGKTRDFPPFSDLNLRTRKVRVQRQVGKRHIAAFRQVRDRGHA